MMEEDFIKIREIRLPEEVEASDFYKTLQKRHKEVIFKTKLRYKEGEAISWELLNEKLERFPGEYSWYIAQYWASLKLQKDVQRDYKQWYNQTLLYTKNYLKNILHIKETPQYLIEATMQNLFKSRINYWNKRLDNLDLLVGFYKDFRDLWKGLKDVYQTLSSNLREEFKYNKI